MSDINAALHGPVGQAMSIALCLMLVIVVYAAWKFTRVKELTVAKDAQAPKVHKVSSASISPASTMETLPCGERREVLELHGKVVVCIGAGSSPEKRSIYETAHSLGVRVVILDGPGSWASSMLDEGIIAGYYPVSFDADPELTLANMLSAVERVRAEVGSPDGVCTFFEVAVPIATRLAAALGLPANPIEAVDQARDKHATRAVSARAGLPTPKHASIESADEVEAAAEVVGFPAVIKPIGMFQSMGVLRVNSYDELTSAYGQVLRELAHAREVAQGAPIPPLSTLPFTRLHPHLYVCPLPSDGRHLTLTLTLIPTPTPTLILAAGTHDYRATVASLGVKMVLEVRTALAPPRLSPRPPRHARTS